MPDESWKKAIIKVLSEANEPLHYQEITSRILTSGLKSTDGATPAATVNAQIAASIKHQGGQSPFLRVGKGTFTLRSVADSTASPVAAEIEPSNELVKAFGMYWRKDDVIWRTSPSLLGRQHVNATAVDFKEQRGVYILYDHHELIYVGRTTEQSLGQRLFAHKQDRLSERWDRFSWFGLYGVKSSGSLIKSNIQFSTELLIETLEALLIEALEPPLNRQRGARFCRSRISSSSRSCAGTD